MILRFAFALTMTLGVLGFSYAQQPSTAAPQEAITLQPEQRADVQAFLQKVSEKHGIPMELLHNWFSQVHYQSYVVDAMNRQYEALPWGRYSKLFLTQARIEQGAAFYLMHEELLQRASQAYGVDPFIIVAILGIETNYGLNTGKTKVIDALSTLSFEYPRRAAFFQSELEAFLVLAYQEKWDVATVKGSISGAMGQAQFMPSSYQRYAVDFENKGQRDLIKSTPDAIASIANYFAQHGWKKGAPIITPLALSQGPWTELASLKVVKPHTTSLELKDAGLSDIPEAFAREDVLSVLRFETETGPEYLLAAQNFYVLTRYNHSNNYARAAFALSERIRQEVERSE